MEHCSISVLSLHNSILKNQLSLNTLKMENNLNNKNRHMLNVFNKWLNFVTLNFISLFEYLFWGIAFLVSYKKVPTLEEIKYSTGIKKNPKDVCFFLNGSI